MADLSPGNVLPESDAFTPYENSAVQEIKGWAEDDPSVLSEGLRLAKRPLDWLAERPVTEDVMEEINERIIDVLNALSDASTWTYDEEYVLRRAREEQDLSVGSLAELRTKPMDSLDNLAHSYFTENAVLSVIEGGGTGLGGAVLLAADIPMLFSINLRLIQQIAASYGFRFGSPEARPLVLRIFSAATADTPEARREALQELRAAGAALAKENALSASSTAGRVGVSEASSEGTQTTENQSRALANEIARNVATRQMAQLIPLAGVAAGAGINYWFTMATAETAYMLSRALFLEHKRQQKSASQEKFPDRTNR
jgi:uncharacterized protein (DUF697 family)